MQLQVHPYTLHLEEYHACLYRSALVLDTGVPDRQASLVLPPYGKTHSSPLVTSLEQLSWETRMTTKAKENSG